MTARSSRVAIDCRTLQERPLGGVGRSILGQLPHLARGVTVDALLDVRMPLPVGVPAGLPCHSLRGPGSARGFAWLQLAAPRWLRGYGGIFHCPFYGLPNYQPVPMVVTIHDLTFEFAPDWFRVENRIVFRHQARWAARTAGRILVHSDHVREMVLERYERYGVSEERVLVARPPIDACFREGLDGAGELLSRLGIARPYVVSLGGARRRQLDVAIAAWVDARRRLGAAPQELPLLVVGTQPPSAREGVVYAGALEDQDWATVLAGASAFCYATLYEGYGMPALESAACGTPVVCARVGSLPELLGDGAAWSDAPEPAFLGEALAGVLADRERADELGRVSADRVRALPTWAETAAVTLRAYRESLA